MDRAALHNPFALFLSSRLHIRGGVKTEPIITQGNQAIWHTDQWPPWLMGLLSRWTAPQRDACSGAPLLQGRGGGCWWWRSSGGHSDDAMHQTNPKEIIQQNLSTVWGVCKLRRTDTLIPFDECLHCVCGTIQSYAVTCNDCGSLKETPGRSDKCPHCFLKDPLEAFRDRQLTLIPSSSSSKLSLILGRK